MNTEEQLDVSLREHSYNIFGNSGDFLNLSREHAYKDLLLGA